MDTHNHKNFSPKNAGGPLTAARHRLVGLLRQRVQGEGAGPASNGTGGAIPTVDTAPAPSFVHWERHLATRMGLAMDTVRSLRERHLVEGSDYGKVGRGRIMYSEKGAARLREVALVPSPTSGEKAALEQQQEVVGTALIVWRKCPNAHIVLCHEPGKDPGDVRVRLWVKNNGRFRPGMEVKARHLQEDLYEMLPSEVQFRKGVW